MTRVHTQVYHGGPAHLSGQIASFDYLESVDGAPVVSAAAAQDLLLGPLGTVVVVRVRQGAGGDSANVQLLRQDVHVGNFHSGGLVGIAAALRVVRDGVLVDKVCAHAHALLFPRRHACACCPRRGPCAAGSAARQRARSWLCSASACASRICACR